MRTQSSPSPNLESLRSAAAGSPSGSPSGADHIHPAWLRFLLEEDINFLLTNRIPRRFVTQLMGWFSRIESESLTRLSIAIWRRFSPDLDLSEALHKRFTTLRECFIRELKPGARPIDRTESVIVSPCDAIVGAMGRVRGTEVFQAKGFPYSLEDLLRDPALVERHRDGWFVTLRLRSSMYHRFHAPCDARVREVRYISGDTWNVNPIALKRVERLFCKNERAVIDLETDDPRHALTLVPVAAILVASIELPWLGRVLDLSCPGDHVIPCEARFERGQQMGWFQHGSTIVVFATGAFEFAPQIREGETIRMGSALFRRTRDRSLAGLANPPETFPIPTVDEVSR